MFTVGKQPYSALPHTKACILAVLLKISLALLWPCDIFNHMLPLLRVSLLVGNEEFEMSF